MSKMSDMAMTIEELRSAAAAINESANWLAEQFGGTADEAPSTKSAAKEELYKWADEVLKPTAALAFAGDGNFLDGEWCGFLQSTESDFASN